MKDLRMIRTKASSFDMKDLISSVRNKSSRKTISIPARVFCSGYMIQSYFTPIKFSLTPGQNRSAKCVGLMPSNKFLRVN